VKKTAFPPKGGGRRQKSDEKACGVQLYNRCLEGKKLKTAKGKKQGKQKNKRNVPLDRASWEEGNLF